MTDGSSQGLFVIVAVVIFGIFVAIAYLLFRDKLQTGLASIFEDSLLQVNTADTDGDNNSNNNNNNESGDTGILKKVGDTAYYNVQSNVWVLIKKLNNTDVSIIDSGTQDGFESNSQGDGLTSTDDLVIPIKIYGYNVVEIGDRAFYKANFKYPAHLQADSVKKVGAYAFYNSYFSGDFNIPSAEEIGEFAFYYSSFTGNFNAPNLIQIDENALYRSMFVGDFNAPNVTIIKAQAFDLAKFNNQFYAPKVKSIGDRAFTASSFKGDFVVPNVEEIGEYAFSNSKFTGKFEASKVKKIGQIAFFLAEFDTAVAPKIESLAQLNGNLNSLL